MAAMPLGNEPRDEAVVLSLPTSTGDQRFSLHVVGGRLHVRLIPPVRGPGIDVSGQPGVVAAAAAGCPTVGGVPAAAHAARVATGLCTRGGAWTVPPAQAGDLCAVLGGASFPLLGAAYERGAAALRHVPRWAHSALRSRRPADAARAGFGAKATRATARALAVSLWSGPGAPPTLAGLALALAGAAVLEPDELVAVLAAAAGNDAPCSTDDVRRLGSAVVTWGRHPAARLLKDAAADRDRTSGLLQAARVWEQQGRHWSGRVAGRVDDLTEGLRAMMPVDPGPPAPRPPRARRAASTRDEARRDRDQRTGRTSAVAAGPEVEIARPAVSHRPLRPPVPLRAGDTGPIPVDGRLRPLDGTTIGDLRLVLPRTTTELAAWGARLHNCLATYATAARSGVSLLIGVEHHDRLRYCVELDRSGRVRQFLGPRNRPPDAAHEQAVLRALGRVR